MMIVRVVFAGIPGSEVLCGNPVWVLGCNMVGHHCNCAEAPVCPGETPFSFTSREECEMNLVVMLEHEQSDALPQGRLPITFFLALCRVEPGTWTAKDRSSSYTWNV
jgi:hypothetical protein